MSQVKIVILIFSPRPNDYNGDDSLKMNLFQELCSNGDLRNHLKSFDFVKTMTQVITVMQKWQEVMMTMVMLQRTKNKEKLGDIVDDSE